MKKDLQGLAISTTPPHYLTDCNRKKERSSNLELYRIVVMLLIVMHHYVFHSGLLDEIVKNPTGNIYFFLFGMWGKVGINCFVLITGYFMCHSKITLHKFLKLFLEVEFYSIILGAIFIASGYTAFSWRLLYSILIPFNGVNTNFTACFLLFYLIIPFLNICINNINKKQHLLLLLLCVFIYTVLGSLSFIYRVSFNYVTWFCVLYVIASYLKKYPIIYDNSFSFWGIMTAFNMFISVFSIVSIIYLCDYFDMEQNFFRAGFFLIDSNKILALSLSVSMFMMFKNLRLKYSKVINTIGSCTFGVFLIHDFFGGMRPWLWKDVCQTLYFYHHGNIYLHSILACVLVFVVCALIDFLRQKTVEQPLLHLAESFILRQKLRICRHYEKRAMCET